MKVDDFSFAGVGFIPTRKAFAETTKIMVRMNLHFPRCNPGGDKPRRYTAEE
jgi:hypothetical protein